MPTPSKDLLPPQEVPTPRSTCPPSPPAESSQANGYELNSPARPTEGNTALDMAISQETSLYSTESEPPLDDETFDKDGRLSPARNGDEERNRVDDGKSEKSGIAFGDGPILAHPDVTTVSAGYALTPQSMNSIVDRPSPTVTPSPIVEDAEHPSSPSIATAAIQASSPSSTAPISSTSDPATSITSPSPWDFTSIRLTPQSLHHSSFLRPGARFTGTQRSDRQIYNVDVSLQHVSIPQSFLCGYLRIQGLTEDHPSLTTYFEGELIGTTHTFITKHPDWGATEKIDQSHWERFTAFKPLKHEAKKNNFTLKGWWNRENIFMRWKEHFLVPDHRVRTIQGASFEGFYYICYNQVEGRISGIYFHAKSEKYQQLELNHVDDLGCWGAQEFR